MRKILVTGPNSYIGRKFKEWVEENYNESYSVDTVSLRDNAWKRKKFCEYDVIYHTVGIAHRREKKNNQGLYYEVNRDLSFEVAKKAKEENVSHFIFLSSMSVFGVETGEINNTTLPYPKSHYGKSKYEGEQLIKRLSSSNFGVSIVRPPMVYGVGCKGNYKKLRKLSKLTPIFLEIENKRSMLHIDTLSNFISILIEKRLLGTFHPQNKQYVSTHNMVKMIRSVKGKRTFLVSLNKGIVNKINIKFVNKIFGDLVYNQDLSNINSNYNEISFRETINLTEKIQ
jgi:nucleoside-diphosphate-sugar epimerase